MRAVRMQGGGVVAPPAIVFGGRQHSPLRTQCRGAAGLRQGLRSGAFHAPAGTRLRFHPAPDGFSLRRHGAPDFGCGGTAALTACLPPGSQPAPSSHRSRAQLQAPFRRATVRCITIRPSRRRSAARLNSSVMRAVRMQGGGVVAPPHLQSFSAVASTARFGRNAAAPPAFVKACAPAPCASRPARGSCCIRPRTGSRSGATALRASVPVLRQRSLPAGRLADNRLPFHTGTEPSCRHRFAGLPCAA
jgi:hypothetical protein